MNKMTLRFAVPMTALIVGVAAISGCSEDPQEKYNEAIEQLKEVRASRDEARQELQSKKEEMAELQASLDEAQNKLKQANQNVDKTVNDEVLFRTIQRELLDKETFDEAAISVGVKNRVVTLTGNVPDKETHEQALEIARSQAGVKNVKDSLNVVDSQAQQKSQPQPANENSFSDGAAEDAGDNSKKEGKNDKNKDSGGAGGDNPQEQG